ncbi:MAG: ATP-binding protein [Bacilli bacterium]|nr:ATP-binding protein [Bacilli bacterium]
MLVNFALNNVKSFRQWKELSLISSSKLKEHVDHEIIDKRLSVLKNAGIFGANASGKSSIVKGFIIAQEFVVTGRISERNVAFLDDKHLPTSFSFVFLFEDNLYSYGFTIKPSGVFMNYIVEDECIESLNKDGSVKATLYSKSENIYLGNDHPVLKVFCEAYKNNSNILFLTYMNSPDKVMRENKISFAMKRIFDFFMYDLTVVDSFKNVYSIINDTNVDNIVSKLKEYDTGIESATFIDDDRQETLNSIPPRTMNILLNDPLRHKFSLANEDEVICISRNTYGTFEVKKLVIKHKNVNAQFSFHDESHGTKRMFFLLGILFGGVLKDKVFVIDEIEKGCHPNLIKKLILDFQYFNKENNAQLIFTSHMPSLMEDTLRRDEVYFVEKGNDGISDIYSLMDYKDRTTTVAKRYLEGRFGAVPKLGERIDATDL